MRWIRSLFLCSFLTLLSACGTFQVSIETTPSQAGGTPTPTLPTRLPLTHTPLAVTASPAPPTTTATSPPVAREPQRLMMQPGSTSVLAENHVEQGGRASYLVRAEAGQYMMAEIRSASTSLVLEVQAPDGTTLLSAAKKSTFWQDTLPSSGDYLVTVLSEDGPASFTLNITIPVRVTFEPGATSVSLDGQVAAGETNTYLLRALEGQRMSVTVTSPDGNVYLGIYGLDDGQTYVPSASGLTTATFDLPVTQDYVIQCISKGNAFESYTLEIEVK